MFEILRDVDGCPVSNHRRKFRTKFLTLYFQKMRIKSSMIIQNTYAITAFDLLIK